AERGVVVPPVPWVDDQPERRQHVDPVGKLPGRHDADDRVWLAIQRDAPTHDPPVRAEAAPPEAVTPDHDRRPARNRLLREKRPAERGRRADRPEVTRRDELARELLGLAP